MCWKYNYNFRIQFKTRELAVPSNYRYVYYRIVPKELPLFKRIFGNPWRAMFKKYAYFSGISYMFSSYEYREFVNNLHTFGDVCQFLQKQKNLVDEEQKKQFDEWN